MSHPGDLLSAHLDGEATASERRTIDAHLAGCEPCRVELASLTTARDAVRGLPVLDAPAAAPHGRRVLRPALAWAVSGVAVAVLALGLAIGPGDNAATFDLESLRDQHTARVVVDPGISTLRGSVEQP